jgi:hypothetical protein
MGDSDMAIDQRQARAFFEQYQQVVARTRDDPTVTPRVRAADLATRAPSRSRARGRWPRASNARPLRHAAGRGLAPPAADSGQLHPAHPMPGPDRARGREQRRPGPVTDWVRDEDVPAVTAMVRQHEGEAAARIAARWLARQRQGTLLVRDADGAVLGFVMMVALQAASAEDLAADPGAGAVWRQLRRSAPLAPGESAILVRSWMARDSYQDPSRVQSLLFVALGALLSTLPRLAWSFIACRDARRWAPALWLAGAPPIPDAAFEVEGRRFAIFGRDWRSPARPAAPVPSTGSAGSAEHGPTLAAEAQAGPRLAEPELAAEVRAALRDFTSPDLLRHNPLTRSRMVAERAGREAGSEARVAALRSLLWEVVGGLGDSQRRAKLRRALHHAFLEPAGSQERVAEQLGLPLTTYRDHVRAGLRLVGEILWQREAGAGDGPGPDPIASPARPVALAGP